MTSSTDAYARCYWFFRRAPCEARVFSAAFAVLTALTVFSAGGCAGSASVSGDSEATLNVTLRVLQDSHRPGDRPTLQLYNADTRFITYTLCHARLERRRLDASWQAVSPEGPLCPSAAKTLQPRDSATYAARRLSTALAPGRFRYALGIEVGATSEGHLLFAEFRVSP